MGSYTKSLSSRINEATEKNLSFVKEKLKEEIEAEEQKKAQEKQKQEEQKKDEQQKESEKENQKQDKTWSWQESQVWNPGSGEKSGSWQESKTGSGTENASSGTGSSPEKKPSKTWQNWSNSGSYKPFGWDPSKSDEENTPLSPTQQQEIKNYLEELKKFGKDNGKLLNPEKSVGAGSVADQIRNFFGNDSFFQDVLPGNNSEKDW